MGNLILLSGGLDSALCLHKYGAELCVGFDYGQPHAIELQYAGKIALRYGVLFEVHKLMTMPKVNDVVFAGRNAVFLAAAASIAQTRGIKNVIIGCNYSDHERFPDCRPPFIRALSEAYREAYGVTVSAPLLTTSKTAIVGESPAWMLDETWTCYSPKDGKQCGECPACKVMARSINSFETTKRTFEAWTK